MLFFVLNLITCIIFMLSSIIWFLKIHKKNANKQKKLSDYFIVILLSASSLIFLINSIISFLKFI